MLDDYAPIMIKPPQLSLVTSSVGTDPMPVPTNSLPPAIHQFIPHTPMPEMTAELPAIAGLGFTAVQMPPLHPPGTTEFDGKLGSAYAPRDVTEISPHIFAGVSPEDYLAGNYTRQDQENAWKALRTFTSRAEGLGLRVVGDIVFAHTAGDADVIRAHVEKFGNAFYKNSGTETGATLEDGNWDTWSDIVPINHNGPARAMILAHFQAVLNRMIEHGVTVFRADAAPRIPNDFWAELIHGAKVFAGAIGRPVPTFYAEALGTRTKDEVDLVSYGGFDGVTTSLRWWKNLTRTWYLERTEAVRLAGGGGVSFLDNQDTARAFATFDSLQIFYTRLALNAFMSSSMLVMDGTATLDRRQPSVFLSRYRPVATEVPDDLADSPYQVEGALRMLLGIKHRYPILQMPAHTEIVSDGGPILRIQKTTPGEQVQIAINIGSAAGTFYVPLEFRRGNVFGTNTWPGRPSWFDASPGLEISEYRLAPHGMAVFHRRVDPSEKLRIPGF